MAAKRTSSSIEGEGAGEAAVGVHAEPIEAEFLFVEATGFEIAEGDFDGVIAHQLPHGGGEESDEVGFDFVGGGIDGEVGVEVVVVGGFVFFGEADELGAEAVNHTIAADAELAFGGGWAEGFGAVGTGGVSTALSGMGARDQLWKSG